MTYTIALWGRNCCSAFLTPSSNQPFGTISSGPYLSPDPLIAPVPGRSNVGVPPTRLDEVPSQQATDSGEFHSDAVPLGESA